MRYPASTNKQRKYAYHLMNSDVSRSEAMRLSGYSKSMSEKPAVIEKSNGFKLAMAKQAFEAGNIASGIMHEMQVRGYKDYDNKTLFQALDVISKAFERFTPKENKQPSEDMRGIFSNIIDITPENPIENKDITPETTDL